MANSWFRLYAEFANDAKVQMLSETDQRRLVMLFCLRCNDQLSSPKDEEVAFLLRIGIDELERSKKIFVDKKFIDDSWNILSWNERQFITGEANPDAVSKSSNYVYFVADTVANSSDSDIYVVKIGISKNPWARLKDLQTGNQSSLELVAKFRADIVSDSEIHEILGQYRTAGEWFKLPSNLASQIIEHEKVRSSDYISVRSLIVASLRSNTTVATITTTDSYSYSDTEHKKQCRANATALLQFLNSKTNRDYRPVDSNLRMIMARLDEYSLEDLKAMTAKKCREWAKDEKMKDYLRPATLYNAIKCAQYIGELVKVETHE
jgi:uncharacterized phage protein (TIGR02220 family)